MNLVQLLYASVVRAPHTECLRYKVDDSYQSMTYEQFWEQVMRFSAGLRCLGVQAGDKIAIMAENCPEWAISDYAILALGAVVVPIYPTLPAQQATFILRNADVKWVITGELSHLETVSMGWPESIQGGILMHGVPSPLGKPVHQFQDVVDFGEQFQRGAAKMQVDFNAVNQDAVATIVHTSGTSGTPKGVILTHSNLIFNVQASLSVLPIEPGDISLSYLPLSHIFERTVGQFAALSSGGTIAYAENIDKIRENLLEVRPTILVTVPRLLEKVYAGILQKLERAPGVVRKLLQPELKRPIDIKGRGVAYHLTNAIVYSKLRAGLGGRIRIIVSGGAGLAREIAEFYTRAGIPVCEGYGMTETSPVITVNPPSQAKPGTVGLPLPGVEVRIAEDGELLVKGPNVMLGYYGDAEETKKTISSDGWLHTGDIAELVDGYVKIVDRKKNILVLATGKNVAPWPIENAITLSPYIADTVLIGDGRKYVACLVVPDFSALTEHAQTLGLDVSSDDWIQNSRLQQLLKSEILAATAAFAEFERPKRAKILSQPFSLESGELTPTLKVRTKLILAKYEREIEAMYDGTDYLDLYGDSPISSVSASGVNPAVVETSVTELAVENELPRNPYSSRKKWILALAGAALVVVLLVGGASAYTHLPAKMNLLASIKHIGKNNQDINQENEKIVQEMGAVNDLSSVTPKIQNHLQALNQGLLQQNGNLTQLSSLSEQEIQLSQSFGGLANSLYQDLSGINSSSANQSQSISQMAVLTQRLNQIAAEMTSTNQTIAGKLNQATSDTKQVSSEVP